MTSIPLPSETILNKIKTIEVIKDKLPNVDVIDSEASKSILNEIINELKLFSNLSVMQIEECKPKLMSLLNSLDLVHIEYFNRIKILIELLEICKEYELSKSVVNIILYHWCNEDLDIDGILGDLFAIHFTKDEMMKYLVSLYPYTTPVTILDNHIRTRYGSGMIFSYMAERVLDVFDRNLSEDEWKSIISAAEETKSSYEYDPSFIDRQSYSVTRDNIDVLDYIETKMKQVDKIAKVPKYISIEEGETDEFYKALTSDSKSFTPGTSDTEADEIRDFMEHFTQKQQLEANDLGDEAPLTSQEVVETFISLRHNFKSFAPASKDDKHPLGVGTEGSKNLERYYGPINAIEGVNCITSGLDNCPCRMFSCICREFDDEDMDEANTIDVNFDEAVNIWFKGKCDICEAKIKKFRYAVRFPVEGGGWLGCFCSFICMKKTQIRAIYPSDEFRISEIQSIIKEIGICDL